MRRGLVEVHSRYGYDMHLLLDESNSRLLKLTFLFRYEGLGLELIVLIEMGRAFEAGEIRLR